MRGCIIIAILFLGACAPRQDGAYADQSPVRAAQDEAAGRRCVNLARPPAPASLDEATRPGTRWAIMTWADRGQPTERVDVSIRYGAQGQLDWVRANGGNIPAVRAAELERILRGGVSDRGPADWGFRVRLAGGEVEGVLPSVVCPPARKPTTGRRPRPTGTDAEMAESRQALNRRIELDVSLNEEGDVVDVRVTRSSGSRLMDREAVDRALWLRYLPMLHDDMGVPSVLPVTFTVRLVRRSGPRAAIPEVVG
jgi:TonB family protein